MKMKSDFSNREEGYLRLSEDILKSRDAVKEEIVHAIETDFNRSEYITSAYYAIAAMSELDVEIMQPVDRERKQNIMRKSLRMIDYVINQLDSELFDEDEEEG
jgi:hypothetical protein